MNQSTSLYLNYYELPTEHILSKSKCVLISLTLLNDIVGIMFFSSGSVQARIGRGYWAGTSIWPFFPEVLKVSSFKGNECPIFLLVDNFYHQAPGPQLNLRVALVQVKSLSGESCY